LLEQGGNQDLRDFFAKYDLHDHKNIKEKYTSKAAAFYRRRNQALAMKAVFSETEPEYDEGRTLLDGTKLAG